MVNLSDIAFQAREALLEASASDKYKNIDDLTKSLLLTAVDCLQQLYIILDQPSEPITTEAGKALEQIKAGEEVESKYITLLNGVLYVNETALFNDLTEQEKQHLSDFFDKTNPGKGKVLNIWKNSYGFIPFFDKWVIINSYNAKINPDFIHLKKDGMEYILETDTFDIYEKKEIKNDRI